MFKDIVFLIACFLLFGCENNTIKLSRNSDPNIIFILTDDQRWDAIGYSGNSIIDTPEMDRLATEGTYFKKAFVTTPICSASRASILTGLYERTHGYTFGKGEIKEQVMNISYPVKLRENGYYTGFYGKFGVMYQHAELKFDKAEIYDRNESHRNSKGYFYKTIQNETVHLTKYTGFKALEFIQNTPVDQPFCLSLSFSAPHAHDSAPTQYFWQEKFDNKYSKVTIPGPYLSDAKFFNQLPFEVKEGFNRVRWHWRYGNPKKYQQSVKGYYRMISGVDEQIGKIRKLLEVKGITDNTVIIFMGDNGYFMGERQLAGKWLMHDNSIRVPLIIYDPRVNKHHDIHDMVINIDVTKTILDIAGVDIPTEYQGVSLVSYLEDGERNKKRDEILIEHLWEKKEIPSSEGLRSNRWKYFRYRFIDAPDELYNLHNDPREIHNLASDPLYAKELEYFRKSLDAKIIIYLKAQNDLKINGSGEGD